MLIKILGIFDFVVGLILIFGMGLSNKMYLVFGIILLIKSSLGLLKDFASWIDFSVGLMFFLSIIVSIPSWICIILGLLIIQKGVFSFL